MEFVLHDRHIIGVREVDLCAEHAERDASGLADAGQAFRDRVVRQYRVDASQVSAYADRRQRDLERGRARSSPMTVRLDSVRRVNPARRCADLPGGPIFYVNSHNSRYYFGRIIFRNRQ